jgi:hypothetical protein
MQMSFTTYFVASICILSCDTFAKNVIRSILNNFVVIWTQQATVPHNGKYEQTVENL